MISDDRAKVALIGLGFLAVAAFIGVLVWISAGLFAFNVRLIFGVDAPWYIDVIGGCVCNAFNVPLAVVLWILRAAGQHMPLFTPH